MTRLGDIAYPALAFLAMLGHLMVVGLLGLVVLSLVPAGGTEIPALALKALVVLVWGGLGLVGFNAWRQRSWVVVAVPIASFCIVALVKGIGDAAIHWTLGIGY